MWEMFTAFKDSCHKLTHWVIQGQSPQLRHFPKSHLQSSIHHVGHVYIHRLRGLRMRWQAFLVFSIRNIMSKFSIFTRNKIAVMGHLSGSVG